jgi:hypothetical protein
MGNGTLLTLIESSLSEIGIDPRCLILEVSETPRR